MVDNQICLMMWNNRTMTIVASLKVLDLYLGTFISFPHPRPVISSHLFFYFFGCWVVAGNGPVITYTCPITRNGRLIARA